MGIIARQGIKFSLVRYITIFIGALSSIFIYPRDLELNGLLGFLIDSATLFSPIVTLGVGYASVKFYPEIIRTKSRLKFTKLFLGTLALGVLLFVIIFYISEQKVIDMATNKSENYSTFIWYILPTTILFGVMTSVSKYITNYKRIVIQNVIENIAKISLPIIFLLIYFNFISIRNGVALLLLTYIVSIVLLVLYLFRLEKGLFRNIKLEKNDLPFRLKSYWMYSFFATIGGIGSLLAYRIDSFMIPTLMEFNDNGVYRIASFIAIVIAVPSTALLSISLPVVSEAWNNNDMRELNNIYKKSSLNLQIVGGLMLLCILSGIGPLITLMATDADLSLFKYIILILGIAKLVDMTTGVSQSILLTSDSYKLNFYALAIMGLANIGLNFIFIKSYGLIGAATATMISVISYNLFIWIVLYTKYNLQSFTRVTLSLFILLLVCTAFIFKVDISSNIWIDSILKGIITVGSYLSYIVYTSASEDISQILDKVKMGMGINK